MKRIDPSEISVVVQGPIVGAPNDTTPENHTFRCLQSIQEHLPGAEVILSTWKDSSVEGFPYDVLVTSDDPAALPYQDNPLVYNNLSRQIVSARAGLRLATRPFAIKFRTDMSLVHRGFLDYADDFPDRDPAWAFLQSRVLACTLVSRNPRKLFPYAFHPSDWFHFGRTEDVLSIWDIPLPVEPEHTRWFANHPRPPRDHEPTWNMRYASEQYIWLSVLNKYREVSLEYIWQIDKSIIETSERSIANNLVLLEPDQLGIQFLKYAAPPADRATTYTHREWKALYDEYARPSAPKRPARRVTLHFNTQLFLGNLQPTNPLDRDADVSYVLPGKAYPQSLTREEGELLYRIIYSLDLRSGVEIGSGLGVSTMYAANAFAINGGALMTCDAFVEEVTQSPDGTDLVSGLQRVSAELQSGRNPTGLLLLHHLVKTYSLVGVLRIVIGLSPYVFSDHPGGVDFAYIDGGRHADQPLRDAEAVLKLMGDSKTLVFRHYGDYAEVTEAVNYAARQIGNSPVEFGTKYNLTVVSNQDLTAISL